MDNFAKKRKKTLNVLAYLSITFGYIAMVAAFYLFIYSVILMLKIPALRKIPQLVPFLPYVPQLFKLPVPEFIFIHWLIIIIIMATTHEFSHGIFSRFYNIKIKSTGFGFLGPIMAAFVEPDEKQMAKSKKKAQLAILSGGSFSNFLFGILFGIITLLFLYASLSPSTVYYAGTTINLSGIQNISLNGNSIALKDLSTINANLLAEQKIIIETKNQTYLLNKDLLLGQKDVLKTQYNNSNATLTVYYNSPAINLNVQGEILRINSINVRDSKIFDELAKIKPGQQVTIETKKETYTLIAQENPNNSSRGYTGIAYVLPAKGFISKAIAFLSPMKNPFMSYSPRYNKEVFRFIFIFFFWLLTALFGVALLNMLPLGFLDGGKFAIISALAITKSEKTAKIIYRILSAILILIFLILFFVPIYFNLPL
jgi:membrane-associated protease RseP (regulator of RpoE activity)